MSCDIARKGICRQHPDAESPEVERQILRPLPHIILKTAMEMTADYANYAEEEGLGFLQRVLL